MQDIQEIFDRIQVAKKEQRDIRKMYKDALDGVGEYQEIQEKMKSLREKKKRIETTIKEQFASEITKLEDLKIDIESDTEVLTDVAMSKIMKGETLEIKDKDSNDYEPVFKVNFKKVS
ncbi:MAG: hypothetical protein HYV41_02810 [Candidatus Magasanikbacteria bacterium]|nr:hypothetical protein [Candidatus Magasanikbacteria bacterium]